MENDNRLQVSRRVFLGLIGAGTGSVFFGRLRRGGSAQRGAGLNGIRPGGHVANVGVHGHSATLHLETLWIKDVTITTGLVDTFTTPRLLDLIAGGRLDPTPFATHRFGLSDTLAAYETFAAAGETNALKVVLEGEYAVRSPQAKREAVSV